MRITLIILIVSITSTYSFGQKFSIGSEIGILSSINTDYQITDFEKRRNTYYLGLNLNYKLNDLITITSGFHYLRQGYRLTTCYLFEEGVKNRLIGKVDYLAIPLSANIYLLKSRKLITTFGLFGAYNIKAVQEHPEPIGGCEIFYIPEFSDFTKDYLVSGIFGISYKILENEKIELISSLKYYQGFTNTFDAIFINLDRKYSAAAWTISFNYKFYKNKSSL